MALTPAQAVDTAASVFGKHPGCRALHARGVICRGTFTPTAGAAQLSRAAHLVGPEVPVTVRFSNGSGNPKHPDWAPDPRGLAIKFYLPDGSRTDIVAVSSPVFPTRTPEGFIELIRAQAAGPAAAIRIPLFLRHHPEALRVLPRLAPSLSPPAGYDTIPYYGIRERMASSPVMFSLQVQVAAPGDPIDDPSAAWPRRRRKATVGTLSVTGLDTERDQGDDVLVFDPSRVTDGIECSDDPVLAFRPAAYSESIRRRTESR